MGDHSHSHSHGQGGGTAAGRHRGRLAAVLGITVTVLVTEVVGGLLTHSLVLIADAGHMATDAAGIGLSLLATWFATRPATVQRSFGYQRAEILAAVVNAVLLFGVGALILIEATRRLFAPPEVGSALMIVFGLLAVLGNGCSLLLLRAGQAQSLNVRGAFLEVLSDLLGAGAVIVAAAVIQVTGYLRADALASLVIGVLILPRTYRLLRDAVDVLLEATPRGVDIAGVRRHITDAAGVVDVHDLHVWTITSGVPVLSAHVVVSDECFTDGTASHVLDELQHCLGHHFDVAHSTFQLEAAGHLAHEPGAHT